MGPLADRMWVSNIQLTALTAGIINQWTLDDISISKSTTRRSRATARATGAKKVKVTSYAAMLKLTLTASSLLILGASER